MLPKPERLKDRRVFDFVFSGKNKGKLRVSSRLFTLCYLLKRKNINMLPKVAFIVGTKIDKRSVKRNLIKRRMREAYKIVKKKLFQINKNILDNYFAFIWIANLPAKDATFDEIVRSMESLLCLAARVEVKT